MTQERDREREGYRLIKDLYELGLQEEGVIVAIEGGRRLHLTDLGLRVGKHVRMVTRQPLGGPVVVQVDQVTLSLGKGLAQKIKVEVDE